MSLIFGQAVTLFSLARKCYICGSVMNIVIFVRFCKDKAEIYCQSWDFLSCMSLANGSRGKLGKVAYLEKWLSTITPFVAGETVFTTSFDWDETTGAPEAFIVTNHHHSQFYLKTVTLEDVPSHGRVHFVCNSWVYPAHRYKYNRVFFSNKVTFNFWTTKLFSL